MRKKKSLLTIAVGMVLAAANGSNAMARDVSGVSVSPASTLPITGVTEATDGIRNFKSFEIEAPAAGSYYTEFWLLPARYADNSFSTFMIYVNGNCIGTVSPTAGNWQAARIEGHETLNLTAGTNVISVAVPAPEFPEVETIKVALNDADAMFSPEAYEEFLADAAAGVSYDIFEDEDMTTFSTNAAGGCEVHFLNVPLNYTFRKTFSFKKGQDILITTSSSAEHKIDVVYYGSNPVLSVDPDSIHQEISEPPLSNISTGTSIPKSIIPYIPATSEEMQGLGFVFPSEKALNSDNQEAIGKVKIPKSGKYLIRVRHAVNGSFAMATVNVNNISFDNVPITLSYKPYVIPCDSNYYVTYTVCSNAGTDNPYLFVHGADCDRIVAFNDDCPAAISEQYNLSARDSYISQQYLMKTSGISVNNYSSSNPTSSCDIIMCQSVGNVQSVDQMRSGSAKAPAWVTALSTAEESVEIIAPTKINGTFSIIAPDNIRKVSIYGLAGNCIGTVSCKESSANISASSLNITQPGIYIVSVETSNGFTSRKVAVRK